MTVLAADPNVWAWNAHVEVWALVAGLTALYLYAARVIGPKVVPAGQPVVTRHQWWAFGGAIGLLWFASDWPVHDIGEQYVFSVHMVQHMVLTLVMPPLFLIATPRWLFDLVIGDGAVRTWVRRLSLPVVAGILYNATVLFTHWPPTVNAALSAGWVHFSLHVLVVTTALIMWMPVCGPVAEWRMSLPGQMVYLFLMSIVPTVPGAWLTLADNPLYEGYDTEFRAWGISAVDDQQAAGLIMKLVGGMYLWAIITGMFFVWAARHEQAQKAGRSVSERDVLTWQKVEAEMARSTPPAEPAPGPTLP